MSPIIDVTPIDFIRRCAGKIPSDLTEMFAESESQFIRSMCKAIFNWEGFSGGCPLFRIHGTRDLVIPIPADVDVKISGGHLIAMSHPIECVEAIRENAGSRDGNNDEIDY